MVCATDVKSGHVIGVGTRGAEGAAAPPIFCHECWFFAPHLCEEYVRDYRCNTSPPKVEEIPTPMHVHNKIECEVLWKLRNYSLSVIPGPQR